MSLAIAFVAHYYIKPELPLVMLTNIDPSSNRFPVRIQAFNIGKTEEKTLGRSRRVEQLFSSADPAKPQSCPGSITLQDDTGGLAHER